MHFGLGEFFSLACALAWAIAVILLKKSGEHLAPFALNLFKNVLSLALFAATVLALEGVQWPGIPAWACALALVSGFLGIGLGDTLYLRALNSIGASRMGVAQTMYSPFVILLSTAFLGERLNALQIVGVALVLSGVMLVTYERGAARADAAHQRRGVLYAGLSVFVMAAGVVIAKPLLERYDFLWIVTLRIVGGLIGQTGLRFPSLGSVLRFAADSLRSPQYVPYALFMAWRRNGVALWIEFRAVRHWRAIVAGSAMGGYASMMLWLAGYKYTAASIAAVLNEFAAIFILALAAVFLKERVRRRQLAGALLAVAGVVLVVARRP